MSRLGDWREASPDEWRALVARDLDIVDHNISAVREDHRAGVERVQKALDEVKEQQKWILRTMWALLVGLMMLFAGVVTTVLVP